MLELLVLGAGPAYSDDIGSVGSAYLVREGPDAIVMDLGQGAFPRLAHSIEPSGLKGVFISHLHPDHFIDLIPRSALPRPGRVPSRPESPGGRPAGLERRLDATYDDPGSRARRSTSSHSLVANTKRGASVVEVRAVPHVAESFAFRVSGSDHSDPGSSTAAIAPTRPPCCP